MPIRFRCAYCNQLMGIARRKAGSVVSCPTCNGQVVVPQPEPEDDDDQDGGGVFEEADFENVFQRPTNGAGVDVVPRPSVSQLDVEPVGLSNDEPQGCLLTTGKIVLLGIIMLLLIALAFVGGLLIGRSFPASG